LLTFLLYFFNFASFFSSPSSSSPVPQLGKEERRYKEAREPPSLNFYRFQHPADRSLSCPALSAAQHSAIKSP
jgi:hypothetical protein